MTRIYIKGFQIPVEVSKDDGIAIEKIFLSPDVSQMQAIKTEFWTGRKSEIKSIVVETADFELKTNQSQNQFHDGEIENYKRTIKIPANDRAKETGFFKMMYSGFTGDYGEVSKTLLQSAIVIQEKWYSENPTRMYPSPIIFKSLFRSSDCDKNILAIMERAINHDKFMSRVYGSNK